MDTITTKLTNPNEPNTNPKTPNTTQALPGITTNEGHVIQNAHTPHNDLILPIGGTQATPGHLPTQTHSLAPRNSIECEAPRGATGDGGAKRDFPRGQVMLQQETVEASTEKPALAPHHRLHRAVVVPCSEKTSLRMMRLEPNLEADETSNQNYI
ncbi:hypothetical protein E2C01_012709 [Portunus trituberculatus]|uniref:Uncharacterized protein n=1 Tax=Portunus trituberculatus TaxID=210409 RepID=A0A5B7DEV3_PORTR|nr:hypothetical protein [Portunus trituberculatus]